MSTAAALEKVHYTQRLFRQLMDAMARPGTRVQLEPAPYKREETLQGYLLGIGLTLLDQETSFHIDSAEPQRLARDIQLLTMARTKPLEASDYVFVTDGRIPELHRCMRGDFLYPDRSATIIYEVESLQAGDETSVEPESGPGPELAPERAAAIPRVALTLAGPGIKGERRVIVAGLPPELLPQWQQANAEFPLGLDWILVDVQGCVVCVPRSTKMRWEVL